MMRGSHGDEPVAGRSASSATAAGGGLASLMSNLFPRLSLRDRVSTPFALTRRPTCRARRNYPGGVAAA